VRALEDTPAVFVSALQEESLTRIRDSLKARIRVGLQTIRVSVSPGDGETIATLHRNGEVLEQRSSGPDLEIDVRIPTAFVGRLRARAGIAIQELD
jgi:GTP-binding protein HflX